MPVFRCAKIAKLSYDYVFGNGGMGFSEYADGLRKNVIRVCVNTDDPAIFCTTLENEFMLLQYGAKNNMDDCDNIEEVENWLRNLKKFNDKVFEQDLGNAQCARI